MSDDSLMLKNERPGENYACESYIHKSAFSQVSSSKVLFLVTLGYIQRLTTKEQNMLATHFFFLVEV